jgi:hypothetical protein
VTKTKKLVRWEERSTGRPGLQGRTSAEDQRDAAQVGLPGLRGLGRQVGNQAVQRFVIQRNGSVPAKELERAAGPTVEQQQANAESFATTIKGEKPKSKSQAGKAVQKGAEALLKTKPVAKLLKRKLKGRASTAVKLFQLGAGFATWLATKTDTVTTPDIHLRKNVSISFEYKGTGKKFSKVMVYLKVRY